jgi:mRNA interferase HicA
VFPATTYAAEKINNNACKFKHFCLLYHRLISGRKMKISEFKRFLENLGARIEDGKKHWKVTLNGKHATLPRHPSRELREGTRQAIRKQLGIE